MADVGRDPEAEPQRERLVFIEDFALVLAGAGLQRMAARVLAAILSSQSGAMSARELTEVLGVSPAAISGAVRTLQEARFLVKVRRPSERVDQYSLGGAHWYESVIESNQIYSTMAASLERGVEAVGPQTDAGSRLAETSAFFRFIAQQIPDLVQRWHLERSQGVSGPGDVAPGERTPPVRTD